MTDKTKKDNIKNYLIFRYNVEKSIDEIKAAIKESIKPYKEIISNIPNVSIQKIEYYISLFKAELKDSNAEKMTEEIYKFMITKFDYNRATQNYVDNEKIIKEYITKSIENYVSLKSYRADKRAEVKHYREINKGQINFNIVENAFVEMKRNMKSTDENYMSELQEARDVANEIMGELNNENTSISKVIIEKPVKQPKPKKQKPYKMTEAEVIRMMFGSKEITETLQKV